MILQFLIDGKRHAFTVEEARALHSELTAFFGSYVVDSARLRARKAADKLDEGFAFPTPSPSSTEEISRITQEITQL
jgi:hypothetical protein